MIKDKKGFKNIIADYLSRLDADQEERDSQEPISELFLDETLLAISQVGAPWFTDIANFLSSGIIPEEFTPQYKKMLFRDSKFYIWDKPFLWRLCNDGMARRCIARKEVGPILHHCHGNVNGGHYGL